jgi:PDZ domain-containing protein
MEGRKNVKNKRTVITYILLIAIIVAAFIPLPFYVTKPGDTGTLMLTTIRMGPANIYSYIWAKFRDYENILSKEEVRYPHESDDEYNVRQFHLMDTSQQNAITVAFDEAGKTYNWTYNGIFVLGVFPGMPAEKVLEAGDRITAIDGQKLKESKEMTDYVQSKKSGETVTVMYERDEEEKEAEIELRAFPELDGKSGLGISLADDRTLKSNPKVTLEAEEIGGPSAGLMFSLEIYDQLVPEDVAAGLRVAGTGTIAADGTVGRIGGIDQKVVAADHAGAEIFFAPDDELPKEAGDLPTNYEQAKRAAEDIKTNMKIVPVQTFSDAVNYLANIDVSK